MTGGVTGDSITIENIGPGREYVQPDGTLGTSTGTPPCLAGLALSSSKLLIREGKSDV